METSNPKAFGRSFAVRTMTRAEVDLALDWAAAEGWNPGKHDADCFHAADPNGFFVGVLDGEPIGCISTVAYSQSFGFLGLYIVRPDFRGKGQGIRTKMFAWGSGLGVHDW